MSSYARRIQIAAFKRGGVNKVPRYVTHLPRGTKPPVTPRYSWPMRPTDTRYVDGRSQA